MIHAELRVELPNPAVESTRVVASCSGERLMIEILDPVSRKLLRRNFALRNPSYRGMGRLVGIAATELILASWAELAINPNPAVEPEGPPPDPALLQAARERVRVRPLAPTPTPAPRASPPEAPPLTPLPPDAEGLDEAPPPRRRFDDHRFRVVAMASRRSFFAYPGALWGGGARVGAEPLRLVSWAADLSYESGELKSDQTYDVDSITAGGQLFLWYRIEPVTLRLGGGLRAGFAASSPRGVSGADTRTVAPWGWPLLSVNVSAQVVDDFLFELSAEASYSTLPVSGKNGDPPEGAWFAAQLGLGFIP